MKITFLGTGAADWPIKRPEDSTEFRRLSSALIDDILLIDPGPCVPDAMAEFGIDCSAVRFIINTHRHDDHFCPDTVEMLAGCGAEFIEMHAGDEKEIGRYTVRAYRANHATCKDPVHFLISDGEKTVFYGLDGAWLLSEEVAAIKQYAPDFAVLDATVGDIYGDYRIFEHNNLNMVLEMKKSLEKHIKRFCISHMARTLHECHAGLSDKMKQYDVTVAYDGYETEI